MKQYNAEIRGTYEKWLGQERGHLKLANHNYRTTAGNFLFMMESEIQKDQGDSLDMLELDRVGYGFLTNAVDSITEVWASMYDHEGLITLDFKVDSSFIELIVEDNGIGIISDPFNTQHSHKADLPLADDLYGKKGVALQKIQGIIAHYLGQTGYENKGFLKGAKFWYKVPLANLQHSSYEILARDANRNANIPKSSIEVRRL